VVSIGSRRSRGPVADHALVKDTGPGRVVPFHDMPRAAAGSRLEGVWVGQGCHPVPTTRSRARSPLSLAVRVGSDPFTTHALLGVPCWIADSRSICGSLTRGERA
jgi:hypothetical protein